MRHRNRLAPVALLGGGLHRRDLYDTATRIQIEALRDEAARTGDDDQVALALAALVEGPRCFAWRQCEKAINAATKEGK